jgi:hypothetical protein
LPEKGKKELKQMLQSGLDLFADFQPKKSFRKFIE